MTEYRLSKVNKNNLTPVKDKQEIVKTKKQKTDIVPVKRYLVKVVDQGKVVCIKAAKELVKVTGKALTVIGNKLAEIDWKSLTLNLLKDFFIASQESQRTVYYTYETQDYSTPEIYTTEYINEENNYFEQIQAPKERRKTIKSNNHKSIENKNNRSQIQKKEFKSIPKTKQQPLMIENKTEKHRNNSKKD